MLLETVNMLANDQPLPRRYFSITHWLASGAITAIATIRPDLILIYRKPDNESLELVRLGWQSELGF